MRSSDHPLAYIMMGSDNIPGLKGGDFIDAQGRQIQAKYMNEQIITFTNIKKAIENISQILKNFLNSNDSQELANSISNVFSSDQTRINEEYTQDILNQKILSRLQISDQINININKN